MKVSDLWTIVDKDSGRPIPTIDEGGGMLAFCSREAAEWAAEYQCRTWDVDAVARRVDEANLTKLLE